MQIASQRLLADAGYGQYEVSAYAREGQRCRHNLNYWEYGDYMGIGAGAHGKLTAASGEVVRTTRIRSPQRYLSSNSSDRLESRSIVAQEDLAFEFMLNALRLTEGTSAGIFERRTGLDRSNVSVELEHARRDGLLEIRGDRWLPTEFGRRFLNDLQERFLSSRAKPNQPDSTSRADVTERASS
jgi:oxygen-independent coproporphyrinogen-3 oxidase